jgi:hypothetical protein
MKSERAEPSPRTLRRLEIMRLHCLAILRCRISEVLASSMAATCLRLRPYGRRSKAVDLCDSATVALSDGPGQIGLSAIAAKPTQAVISNQWPVMQFASLVVQLLLAAQLSQSGFFTAMLFPKGCRVPAHAVGLGVERAAA